MGLGAGPRGPTLHAHEDPAKTRAGAWGWGGTMRAAGSHKIPTESFTLRPVPAGHRGGVTMETPDLAYLPS